MKRQAIHLFGSVKELQAALGLKTHSAIYMWPEDRPIPNEHYLRIRYQLKPEAFDADGALLPGCDGNPDSITQEQEAA